MRRREAIRWMGLGATGILVAPQMVRADRLADLAARIRATSREKVFDLAAEAIVAGAQPADLLGATFLAGVHDVRPRPVGGNLHSVMLVEAAFRLAERASTPEQAWLVALWTLDGFKGTQREERGDPWVLPPAPTIEFKTEASARRELITALETGDEQRVDRAIVSLLPYHDRESLYEILWPYIACCMAYLGHKIVYGAMTEAVLRRIDWKYAEPTARSLVYGLTGNVTPETTRGYRSAEALSGELPESWLHGKGDDETITRNLVETMLGSGYVDAQKAAVAAIRDGASTGAVWDAVRLGAADLFLRREANDPNSGAAIRSVHSVTELWSMGIAWRAAKSDRTRRAILLQAVAWVPELRDALIDRNAIAMKKPGVLALANLQAQVADTDLDDTLASGDPVVGRKFLARHPDKADAWLARLAREVGPKGVEYHQFKYAVAVDDERRLAHPRWSADLLAPGLGYMPVAASPATEGAERARAALRRVGLA